MNKIMAFNNEHFIYAQVSSTAFLAFLMGNKSSVGYGGGYDDLGNLEESQFSYRRTRNAEKILHCASFSFLNGVFEFCFRLKAKEVAARCAAYRVLSCSHRSHFCTLRYQKPSKLAAIIRPRNSGKCCPSPQMASRRSGNINFAHKIPLRKSGSTNFVHKMASRRSGKRNLAHKIPLRRSGNTNFVRKMPSRRSERTNLARKIPSRAGRSVQILHTRCLRAFLEGRVLKGKKINRP